jgi:hypothetical protein
MEPINTLDFVCNSLSRLEKTGIQVWLFGGWAEELWQICAPRAHRDIDLLYPASDFHALDDWIGLADDLEEIRGKRFSHKRAVLYRTVPIEFFLLESQQNNHVTNFFDGRARFTWPAGTLAAQYLPTGDLIRLASPQALQVYRQYHSDVEQAYQAYWCEKKSQ